MINIEKVNDFFLQYLTKMRLKVSFLGVLYSAVFVLIHLVFKNTTGVIFNGIILLATLSFLIFVIFTKKPQNELTMLLFNLYFILYLLLFLINPYESFFICGLMTIPFVCYLFNSIEDLFGNDTLHWGYALYFQYGIVFFIPVLVIKPYLNRFVCISMEPFVLDVVRTFNIGFSAIMTLSTLYDLRTVKKAKDYMEEFAVLVDDLTQIFNRKVLKKLPDENYNTAFLDLDFFKNINDTYGHDAGDIVLKDFADIVSEVLQKYNNLEGEARRNRVTDDFIFLREGGEEFLLLGKVEAGSDKFIQLVKNVCEEIKSRSFQITDKHVVYLTISAGINIYEEGVSLEQGIIKADRQVYQAKNAGRKCIFMNDKVLN